LTKTRLIDSTSYFYLGGLQLVLSY